MYRRKVLVTAGTAITASIAGCSGDSSGDSSGGSDPSGPEDVAQEYVTAVFEGNIDEAQSYAIGAEADEITEEYINEQAALDIELEDFFGVEEEGSVAAVRFTYAIDTSAGAVSETGSVLLVQDGDWKVSRMYEEDSDVHLQEAALYTDAVDGPASVAADYVSASRPESDDDVDQFVAAEFEHPDYAVERVESSSVVDESRLENSEPLSTRAVDLHEEVSVGIESISEGESRVTVDISIDGPHDTVIPVVVEQIDGEWKVVTYEEYSYVAT